ADALREARTRIAVLRGQLGGADPLSVLDAAAHQRASDAGAAGVDRIRGRLAGQAEAARALARLPALAAGLGPQLVQAARRRQCAVSSQISTRRLRWRSVSPALDAIGIAAPKPSTRWAWTPRSSSSRAIVAARCCDSLRLADAAPAGSENPSS